MGKTSTGLRYIVPLLLLAEGASAFYTMDVSSSSEPNFIGSSIVAVNLTNNGDEPAFDAIVSLMLTEGFTSSEVEVGGIEPGQTRTLSFNVSAGESAVPGSHPAIILLYFIDKNRYPITMVFPEVIKYQTSKVSLVHVLAQEVTITGDQTVAMPVKVINRDSRAHNVTVVIYLPSELGTTNKSRTILLPPQEQASVNMDLFSSGALHGSNILILLSTSYLEDGVMRSSIGHSRVKIVNPIGIRAEENPFALSWKGIAYAATAALIIAGALVLFYRRKKR